MNDIIIQFINEYGTTILYTLLSTAATILGAWIGKIYKEKANDETKRKVVKTCCAGIEQLYRDLDGAAKYKKACEAISAMLAEKNITITPLEMQMLIEEVCLDFAHSVKAEVAKEDKAVEEVLREVEEDDGYEW